MNDITYNWTKMSKMEKKIENVHSITYQCQLIIMMFMIQKPIVLSRFHICNIRNVLDTNMLKKHGALLEPEVSCKKETNCQILNKNI